MKRGAYEKNNQLKKATFNYKQEGRLCLRVAKIESNNGKITGKRCPLFDYTEKKIVTIYAYKKEILNKFTRIRKLNSSSSPWVEKRKTDKIWLCKSVGKLKGIGKQGKANMNGINIHTSYDLQSYVLSYGFPKLPIRGIGQIYEHGMEALP